MLTSFLKVVSILWAHREIIAAAIPVVIRAQQTFAENADKKAWAETQLLELKRFTPDVVDEGIDATVHLLKLGGIL